MNGFVLVTCFAVRRSGPPTKASGESSNFCVTYRYTSASAAFDRLPIERSSKIRRSTCFVAGFQRAYPDFFDHVPNSDIVTGPAVSIASSSGSSLTMRCRTCSAAPSVSREARVPSAATSQTSNLS